MDEHYRVPPISFSELPLATAPSRAESVTSEPPDPLNRRNNPDLDGLLRRSTTSESTRDDVCLLDIQYLDLIFKFQLLVKKTGNGAALGPQSMKSDVFSSLPTALTDLRVWAYDLSGGDDSFLKSLRNLASRNYDLNARLQQILGNISHLLASIDDEADNSEEVRSRFAVLLV
jgi:hypothetical protein